MTRVAIVIGTALAFAILGLVAGHFSVAVYDDGYSVNAAGQTVRVASSHNMRPEYVLGCYLGAPVFGAAIGFFVSTVALMIFGPKCPGQPGALK